jgi:hypothetical protein
MSRSRIAISILKISENHFTKMFYKNRQGGKEHALIFKHILSKPLLSMNRIRMYIVKCSKREMLVVVSSQDK